MAVNPITSDDLTIDLRALMSIPVGDRVQTAASDSGFAEALMQALTPIQLAKAFPDYYRKELPDISNFILANRYLDSGGVFNQKGGGDYGGYQDMYGGSAKLADTVPRMPGYQNEVEKSKTAQILEKAGILGTPTGETGITSAIQDEKGFIISTADTSLTPEQRALLDTIAVGDPTRDKNYWESPDYNTIVGGKKFENFKDHPRVFGTATSTAAGRYQFTKTTWDDVVGRYNKKFPDNPITDFGPTNQDRAALFLAEERYRNNTGRDLNTDLANPPQNMGELIKVGLGQGPRNLTWEIFTKKSAEDAGNAFTANLARNQGYLEQEVAEEAKKKDNIEKQTVATPDLIKSFEGDTATQEYFAKHPEMANKVQEAINAGKLSLDDVSIIVKGTGSAAINTGNLEDAIVNANQSRVIQDQAQLAGTRKLPLQEDLINTMNYAAQKISEESGRNISMQVFSGGQAQIGTGGPRTGSTEHDLGGAGDVYYVEKLSDGSTRRLNMRNPEDKALMYRGAYHFVRAGGRSVGLESGYMGDEAIHLGISRNNPDPTHHADKELSAIVDQARTEFEKEAAEKGWDERYGYKDFFKQEQEKRIAVYEERNKQETITPPKLVDTAATEKTPEVEKFQFGGTPNVQDDEDLTAVGSDGKPKFKFNSGEGLYVKPEANEYADDKISELSDRVDRMSETQQAPKQREMQPTGPTSDPRWAEKVADAYRPSGTQQRAFNRAQFRNEGRHVGDRGSPNIA